MEQSKYCKMFTMVVSGGGTLADFVIFLLSNTFHIFLLKNMYSITFIMGKKNTSFSKIGETINVI